ncbi:MAG: PAC2 family protein [Thermodesulfobacteriota bacterium]
MAFDDPVQSALTWDVIPELRDPYCVIGFSGWSNAGSVSSDTLEFLIETLKPKAFARISQEPFVNFTVDRPLGHIQEGVIHRLESLETEVSYWKGSGGGHDLVLLLSKEPHLRWAAYAGIVVTMMVRLSAKRLYTIGGVQDTISHHSPPMVSLVGSSPYVVSGIAKLGENISAAEYQGPLSIHSYLIQACADAGIEAVSFWGHVPAYLQKSPRLVAKIVTILNKVVEMECPVDSLQQDAVEFDRRIQEAIRKDPNLRRLVETIERETPRSQSGGTDKVIRLNDFLRKDPHDDGGQ